MVNIQVCLVYWILTMVPGQASATIWVNQRSLYAFLRILSSVNPQWSSKKSEIIRIFPVTVVLKRVKLFSHFAEVSIIFRLITLCVFKWYFQVNVRMVLLSVHICLTETPHPNNVVFFFSGSCAWCGGLNSVQVASSRFLNKFTELRHSCLVCEVTRENIIENYYVYVITSHDMLKDMKFWNPHQLCLPSRTISRV